MAVFEWGSGGSTRFFADRVASVTTIEHVPQWAERVQQAVPEAAVHTVPPDDTPSTESLVHCPDDYRSRHKTAAGFTFETYCRAIDDAAGPFDLIAIDGRCRMACLEHAIPHVKPGGALLLDNSEYDYYAEALANFDAGPLASWSRTTNWGLVPYAAAHLSATDVWICDE